MDQARYWMWNDQSKVFARSSVHSSYHDSWEEQAFAEDASGALGNCVWPPRSYSCSFCGREFRSAQALGGHMNVHRRDRARLKQSPNAVEISHRNYHHQNPCTSLAIQYPSQLCTLSYHGYHDQKVISPLSVSLATSLPFSLNGHNLETKLKRDLVKPDSLLSSTKLVRSCSPETDPDGCEDEARTTKRRRRDSSSSPLAREFNSGTKSNRPSSTVEELHRIFEVPSSIEELDLELRLGSKPKIN